MDENQSAYCPDENAEALAYAEDTTIQGEKGELDECGTDDVEDFCCIYILCSRC